VITDVLLIYPRTGWDIAGVTTRLPLSLLYIGSYLQSQGFSVKVIDQRVDANWKQTLKGSLEHSPLWVGISSMTGLQIPNGLAAAEIVREADRSIPIVWGGVHPSILPEQVLANPLVDIVAVGEGEATAAELSQLFKKEGRQADLSSVQGLVWKKGREVVRNEPRAVVDMQELPPLDYDLVEIDRYILKEIGGERSLQMTTSRGCPMKCGYCYLGTVPYGRRYRAESPERSVQAIENLKNRFPINAIHIIDDEFFIQIKRARAVCELLIEHKNDIRLRTNCRIDALDRMDMETLGLIRRAGFTHIYLGVESGNDRVLEFIDKGITREQVIRVNHKLREAGITPKYSFMGGFPTESLREVKDTLDLMVQLVSENPDAQTTPVQLYTPYPGTPLYDYCVDNGMHMPTRFEEWSDWGWESCQSEWLQPEEKQFLKKAAYFTFFLDGHTISDSLASPLMKFGARLYSRYVRERIRRDIYAFMPEVALIKWKLSE
jgi:anaerobic magnesium-protoporphyrin IX monomethyl ester cyclase